ncbi:anti-phage ZorAB system protein ZorA [Neptunomonas sp.]|uniref:anti-phage ZorAB system protein ZorA n=1 Tax=Neptunomonas sp. TaxID=1971898 RepID=UPI0035664FFE
MESVTSLLISFFHIPNIGLYLAMALMGLGALVIASMMMKFVKVKSALNDMTHILAATTDEADFTSKYEVLRNKIIKVPGLKHTWTEFEETLIPPLEDIDDPNYRVYRNTKRPSDYFSASSVHHFQITAFIQPHTFVGLGLLFTFLGLVAALTTAGASFSSNDFEQIQGALQKLLEVAGTKFWASVGGLFTSIVVGAAYQGWNGSISKRLHTISNLLEERLLYANHERIAVDQYGHSQRQTRRLEDMSTEITLALGDRISDAIGKLPTMLSASLGETMQPVTDELRNVTKNMSTDNQSALKGMVDEFAKKVTGSSSDAFENVNTQLDNVVKALEVTATKLSGGGDELRNGLEGTISNINQTMLDIASQLKESTSEAGSQFKSDAESASSELKDVLLAIKSQQETSANKISQLTDSLEKVSATTSKSINDMIENSGSQLGRVVNEAVGQTSQSVAAALSGLGDDIESRVKTATSTAHTAFTDSFTDLNEKLTTTSADLTGVIKDWQKHLTDISTRFESISGQLSSQVSAVADVNKQVAVTGNAFSQSAQAVRDASTPLTQVAGQLNVATTNANELLSNTIRDTQRTSDSFSHTLTTMAASVSSLQETWETNGKHLKNVDAELENAFRHITNQMSSSLELLKNFTIGFDTDLSSSLEQLSGFVMEVRDLVEEFGEAKARI